MSSFTDV